MFPELPSREGRGGRSLRPQRPRHGAARQEGCREVRRHPVRLEVKFARPTLVSSDPSTYSRPGDAVDPGARDPGSGARSGSRRRTIGLDRLRPALPHAGIPADGRGDRRGHDAGNPPQRVQPRVSRRRGHVVFRHSGASTRKGGSEPSASRSSCRSRTGWWSSSGCSRS